MTTPHTKAARHARIVDLLEHHEVPSQARLAELLAGDGLAVAQATLSRDLDELGAVKVARDDGSSVYAVPGEGGDTRPVGGVAYEAALTRLTRVAGEVLVSAESSANLVVLQTPPGCAHVVASALDRSVVEGLVGTVAGDDTVLVIAAEEFGGAHLADQLRALAGLV